MSIVSTFWSSRVRLFYICFTGDSTGNYLETNVISSHYVGSWLECGQRCLQHTACEFFNYNPTQRDNVNCQLANQMVESEKTEKRSKWTLHRKKSIQSVSIKCR